MKTNAIYQFVWGTFCDWYIELTKPIFYGENAEDIAETKATAAWVLDRILVVLHPFMPFITTELWNNLAERKVKLIHAPWPQVKAMRPAAPAIDWAIDLISTIRSLRSEMNLPASAKLHVYLKNMSSDSAAYLQDMQTLVCSLARLEKVELFADGQEITKDMVQNVFKEGVLLLPLKGVVDFAAERERLNKELENLNRNLENYARKLSNQSFVERAPANVVAEEKRRQAEAMENKTKVEEALARIVGL